MRIQRVGLASDAIEVEYDPDFFADRADACVDFGRTRLAAELRLEILGTRDAAGRRSMLSAGSARPSSARAASSLRLPM